MVLQSHPAVLLCAVLSGMACVTAFQPTLTLKLGPKTTFSCTLPTKRPQPANPGFGSFKQGLSMRACGTSRELFSTALPVHTSRHSSKVDLVHRLRRTQHSLTAILSALILWIGCNGIQDGTFSAKEVGAHEHAQSFVHDVEHRGTRNSLSAISRIHVADGAAAMTESPVPIITETRMPDFDERRDLGLKVALALLASIPLGIVASVLLVGGFSVGGVWGYLGMGVGVVLAAVRFVPRVERLRFRLDDFLNSDFAKIFDFWKLLDSALDQDKDKNTTTLPRGYQVDKMTEEKEKELPTADPIWAAMNADLWGAQERVRLLELELLASQEENAELRARVALLEEEAGKPGEEEGGGGGGRGGEERHESNSSWNRY